MKDPFSPDCFDSAFEPMYSEPVVITLKDGTRQTLEACIFDDSTDDPISDSALDSVGERIQLIFKRSNITFLKTIKRGDIIERQGVGGKKYTVQDSSMDDPYSWVIRARKA